LGKRVHKRLLTIIDDVWFYSDQSELFLKEGRFEEYQEAKFMVTFYENK
jgi:hypothetical protein